VEFVTGTICYGCPIFAAVSKCGVVALALAFDSASAFAFALVLHGCPIFAAVSKCGVVDPVVVLAFASAFAFAVTGCGVVALAFVLPHSLFPLAMLKSNTTGLRER
jgi:hypothetical protein